MGLVIGITHYSVLKPNEGADAFLFVCNHCEADIEVTGDVRDSLLVSGCPVCGSSVTVDAFEPIEGTSMRARRE